ncbi:hypothetical protein Salat_0168600 [Sesamum alatum]|uniref:Uncharacterized protein n=1 Tax=Sesamum alatum TaxID=300844 RepID=A0AAE1YYZ1_9LAMI|nr:hypothetical protein Salat_0168600 [Sesamum alatum]
MDQAVDRLGKSLMLTTNEAEATLHVLFRLDKDMDVRLLENQFLLCFSHVVNHDRVLGGRSWTFDKNFVLLGQIREDENPMDIELYSCPFHVHAHGLPLCMMNQEMDELIGNLIGVVVDSYHARAHYAGLRGTSVWCLASRVVGDPAIGRRRMDVLDYGNRVVGSVGRPPDMGAIQTGSEPIGPYLDLPSLQGPILHSPLIPTHLHSGPNSFPSPSHHINPKCPSSPTHRSANRLTSPIHPIPNPTPPSTRPTIHTPIPLPTHSSPRSDPLAHDPYSPALQHYSNPSIPVPSSPTPSIIHGSSTQICVHFLYERWAAQFEYLLLWHRPMRLCYGPRLLAMNSRAVMA